MPSRIGCDDSPLLRGNGRHEKALVRRAGGEGPTNAGVRTRSEVRATSRDASAARRRTECLSAAGRSLGRRRTGLAMRGRWAPPPAAVKKGNNTAGSVLITRPQARATDLHRAQSASRVARCRLFVLFSFPPKVRRHDCRHASRSRRPLGATRCGTRRRRCFQKEAGPSRMYARRRQRRRRTSVGRVPLTNASGCRSRWPDYERVCAAHSQAKRPLLHRTAGRAIRREWPAV